MADIIIDGKVRVYSVPTIANLSAPTTTELNAGLDLTPYIPPDGMSGWKLGTDKVDNSSLASKFTTNRVGRANAPDLSITFKAQTGTDTIWTTFIENYTTNIVIRRRSIAYTTAFASAQSLAIWPVEAGYRGDEDFAPNTLDRFTIMFAVTSDVILRSVIA